MVTAMRQLWLLPLLALAHCGGGESGTPLTLVQPPGEVVLEDSYDGFYDSAMAGGNGRISYLWSEFENDGSHRIVSQSVAADLTILGDRDFVASPEYRLLRFETACYRGNSLAVAWAVDYFLLPNGITYDLSDVTGSFSWPSESPPLTASTAELQSQHRPSIACLADGGLVLAWTDVCTGAERDHGATFYFTPEHCEEAPPAGTYFRLFDSDGASRFELPIRIGGQTYSSPLVSALGSGGFFVLSGSTVQVRSADGELEQEATLETVPNWTDSIACSGRYCAVVTGGSAVVYDSKDLRSTRTIVFQEVSSPGPDQTIQPGRSSIACDEAGICVIAWSLEHVTVDYDVVITVSLGVFAQAFELDNTRSGAKLRIIEPTESYESGVRLAATGPGEFIVAHAPEFEEVSLSRLSVERGTP
jgi:hypothetical protein